MRHTSAVVILFLLAMPMFPLSAQTVLGIRGGVNIATLNEDGADNRTGVNLGVAVDVPLSESLGLQFGGFYSQKGAQDEVGGATATIALDYIEIPALLRYDLPASGGASVHFLLGPAVAFEASCNAEAADASASVSFDCDEAGIDSKSIDFGAMGGLGLDIGISESLRLTVEGLYNLGLISIDDAGGDTKNRAFTIRAGVGFPLGG